MAYRARFIPKNPEKYLGDPNNIWCRSRWEKTVMIWLDKRKQVLRYGSEEIQIAYIKPTDGQIHHYIPDFIAEIVDNDGVITKYLLEVKPYHESMEKAAKSDRSQDALEINNAKWKAAQTFCELKGWKFLVLTENSIYWQGKKAYDKGRHLEKIV